MPITPLPTAPSRKQSPSAFAENADAFLSQLPTFATEATTLEQTVNAAEVVVVAAESSAVSAKNAAQAAQAAAEAVANATAWDVDEPYTAGQCVYGTDGQTYRAIAASTGVNPVGDATGKWALISAGGLSNSAWGRGFANSDSAAAARTSLELGTAATRDVGESSGNVMQVGARNWGLMTVPTTGLDFNDFTNKVLYPANGASYLYSADNLNGPSNVGTHVFTMKFSDNYLVQLGIQHSGRTFARSVADGSILDWSEVIRSASLLSTTGQSTEYPMTQKAVTDALAQFAHLSMTGSITLNGTTNNAVAMPKIVPMLALEVGDVIRIDTGTYNKLHTVENIVNNGTVRVNYEHAGNRGNGTLRLPDFTGQATVTRIAKWFNAPIGMGQAWQITSKSMDITYTNSGTRPIAISVVGYPNSSYSTSVHILVDGNVVSAGGGYGEDPIRRQGAFAIIPAGSTYRVESSRFNLEYISELI